MEGSRVTRGMPLKEVLEDWPLSVSFIFWLCGDHHPRPLMRLLKGLWFIIIQIYFCD